MLFATLHDFTRDVIRASQEPNFEGILSTHIMHDSLCSCYPVLLYEHRYSTQVSKN